MTKVDHTMELKDTVQNSMNWADWAQYTEK